MNEQEKPKKVEESPIEDINKNVDTTEKKYRLFKILFFIISVVYSLIIQFSHASVSVELGDFGSILPLLFTVVADKGFFWTPIFAVVGFISLFLENKIGKFSNMMITIISVILIVSTIVLIIF